MESPVQDDPYLSLGVSKTASAADIKSAYRKLVLRCHPDKVTDPTLKAQKADEFHKIQQAYEILSDDEKKNRYDARVRLAELKAEMMRRDAKPSRGSGYERPSPPSYPSYSRGAPVEVRAPRFSSEDYYDEPRSTARRGSDRGASVRHSSPQARERERRSEKEDKARSERRRAREADVRDSRDRKYHASVEDDLERSRYEAERKKRDDKVKQQEEAERRYREYHAAKAEEARRVEEVRKASAMKSVYGTAAPAGSSYDMKYSSMAEEARRHQATVEQSYSSSRPQPVRTSSSHQYAEVRRSRAKANDSRRRSPDSGEERPAFTKSATSPEKLRDMTNERGMPSRSYSHEVTADPREYAVPPAQMRRSETMPNSMPQVSTSSRRKDSEQRSSKLRHSETVLPDSGYSSSSPTTPDGANPYANVHPIIPPAATAPSVSVPRTKTYHYPSVATEGLSTSPEKYTMSPSTYNTEVRAPGQEREKDRRRDRDRPALSSVRTVPAPSSSYPRGEPIRAASYAYRSPDAERERDRERERERERDRERDSRRSGRDRRRGEMEYGELPSEYTRKNSLQPKSYAEDKVKMGKTYGYDDVKFADRSRGYDDSHMRSGRERDRYEERERHDRPSFGRSTTMAF